MFHTHNQTVVNNARAANNYQLDFPPTRATFTVEDIQMKSKE